MSKFTRDQFVDDEADAGISLGALARALTVWVAMRSETTTVAQAAETFNTTGDIIRDACDESPWIEWAGPSDDPEQQILELDGE